MLPPKPTAAATPAVATETAAAPAVAASATTAAAPATTKSVIKQFGPAKDANDVVIPSPTVGGLVLTDLSKKLFETVKNFAEAGGVKLEDLVAFAADADKTKFPGHKDGRISYATVNTIASLSKLNGLLNKARGVGGTVALKAKLAEKDAKIDELKAQMAALMAQYGVKA